MPAIQDLILELYVQGQSSRSNAAVDLVQRVCEQAFGGRYQLEVIDILHHPKRAVASGIMATPALVKRSPDPVVRMIGRLDLASVRKGLGLDEQH